MNRPDGRRPHLTGSLSRQLIGAAEALRGCLERAVEPHGLSLPKLEVLNALVEAGEALPLGVLTERLGCAKSNVTQLMDRLEADGLVRRVPEPHDRRSILAEVTELGRERCAAGAQSVAEAEAAFLARLPAADRQRLAAMLGRFQG